MFIKYFANLGVQCFFYFYFIYIRKKSASGTISVQVIDKSSGKYKVVTTIGSSSDPDEVKNLVQKAKQWIQHKLGIIELDFKNNIT